MAASPARSIFKMLQDGIATLTPQYWQFWIGLFLVVFVLVGRRALDAAACYGLAGPGACGDEHASSKPAASASASAALCATSDVTFQLERGARHALIGPNGAGKTTFVNLLTGVLPPSAGQVLLAGRGRHASSSPRRACGAAWCAPSRSTSCSPS